MNLRDRILEKQKEFKVQLTPIYVEAWDTTVYVRSMTAGERELFERNLAKNNEKARATLVVFSLCDENGEAVFSAKDIDTVNDFPFEVIEPIFEAIIKRSAISEEEIEEIEKNSETIPGDD